MHKGLPKRVGDYAAILNQLDDVIALESLREVGVFQALLSGPKDLDALAQQTGTAALRLRAFLDLVRHIGFLEKEGGRYRLVQGDEALFDPDGPLKGNPGVPDFQTYLQRRGAAAHVLRSDEPVASPATGGAVSDTMRHQFLQHVHDYSLDIADEVAQLLTRFHPQRIADLGCGPGTYTIALLAANPEGTAVLVDRPNAGSFVENLCAASHLQHRTTFVAADILNEDFGTGFDLILLSENIHNFGPRENQQLLNHVARSLKPGGRIAIKDTRISADRSGPLSALRFAYSLSIFSPHGTLYPEDEVVKMLEKAQLDHEITLNMDCRPDSYLVVGRKQSAPASP